MKINKEINISISELKTSKDTPVINLLEDIHNRVLSLGQLLSIYRQNNKTINKEEQEELECTCWSILNKLEEISKG